MLLLLFLGDPHHPDQTTPLGEIGSFLPRILSRQGPWDRGFAAVLLPMTEEFRVFSRRSDESGPNVIVSSLPRRARANDHDIEEWFHPRKHAHMRSGTPLPLQEYHQRIQTGNVNEFQNLARFIREALVSLLDKDRTRGLLNPCSGCG